MPQYNYNNYLTTKSFIQEIKLNLGSKDAQEPFEQKYD